MVDAVRYPFVSRMVFSLLFSVIRYYGIHSPFIACAFVRSVFEFCRFVHGTWNLVFIYLLNRLTTAVIRIRRMYNMEIETPATAC